MLSTGFMPPLLSSTKLNEDVVEALENEDEDEDDEDEDDEEIPLDDELVKDVEVNLVAWICCGSCQCTCRVSPKNGTCG